MCFSTELIIDAATEDEAIGRTKRLFRLHGPEVADCEPNDVLEFDRTRVVIGPTESENSLDYDIVDVLSDEKSAA